MSALAERLAVLGLGLLGGSLAGGVRERGLAGEVVGWGRRPEVRAQAAEAGLVDRVAGSAAEAARGADLVVLATPVAAMPALTSEIAPALRPGAVLTDVGSVKARLAETLPGRLPTGVPYVGSHPMAGGERAGIEHARKDLFEGAVCVVIPSAPPDAGAEARVEALWTGLGSRVVRRDAVRHDEEVAWTSHVPHLVSFAFARALAAAPPGWEEVAGPGFRDFTRIARSDPALWAGILGANRKALVEPLERVMEALGELARDLEGDRAEALEQALAGARAVLERVGR